MIVYEMESNQLAIDIYYLFKACVLLVFIFRRDQSQLMPIRFVGLNVRYSTKLNKSVSSFKAAII